MSVKFTDTPARDNIIELKDIGQSYDGGKTWKLPESPPHGYRSCVEFLTAKRLLACGLTGVDISADSGLNWKNISSTGFHVCRKAKKGKAVFLAGSEKIGKLEF